MLDFRMIINGNVPGGVWVLVFMILVSAGILTYVYLSSDLMERKKYIRGLFAAVGGSIFLYSLLLVVFPPVRLIPNVVISPVYKSDSLLTQKAQPYFLSQILRRAAPSKINTIPEESVSTLINSKMWHHPDSLVAFSMHNHIHFVVILQENSDQTITAKMVDTRSGGIEDYDAWTTEPSMTLADQMSFLAGEIISALYPDLKITEQNLAETVINTLPSDTTLMNRMLETRKLVSAGNYEVAIPQLRKWIKEDTGFVWHYHFLGKSLLESAFRVSTDSLKRKQYYREAEYYLFEAVKKDQSNIEFITELADYYLSQGKFIDAADVVKAAFAIDNYYYKVYLQFGRMHRSRWHNFTFPNNEKFISQNSLVQRATELNPFSSDAFYHLGVLLEEERTVKDIQGSRSFEKYAKALELNPNNYYALMATFRLSVLKGYFTNSQEYFDRLLKLSPENPEAWFIMGMNWYFQFNFDSTIYYFTENLKRSPNANAHMYLAAAWENKGDTAKAVEHYTERIFLRESETDPIAASAYKRLRELDIRKWLEVAKKVPPVIGE